MASDPRSSPVMISQSGLFPFTQPDAKSLLLVLNVEGCLLVDFARSYWKASVRRNTNNGISYRMSPLIIRDPIVAEYFLIVIGWQGKFPHGIIHFSKSGLSLDLNLWDRQKIGH